jgi:hypothetical protein
MISIKAFRYFLDKSATRFFISLTFVFFCSEGNAQLFLKPRVGISMSHFQRSLDWWETDYQVNKLGLAGGFGAEYKFDNRIAVLAELNYNQKGLKVRDHYVPGSQNNAYRYRFDYVALPIIGSYPLNSQFNIGGGWYTAYLVHADYKASGEQRENIPLKGFTKFDMGFVLNLNFIVKNMEIGTRYNHGFSTLKYIAPEDPEVIGGDMTFGKHRMLELYFAFRMEE